MIHTNTPAVVWLCEQLAALDDAPDRTRHEWFYADLARLAVDAITDALADIEADTDAGVLDMAAYNAGHDDGYRSGHADGYRYAHHRIRASHRVARRRVPDPVGSA